MLGSHKQGKSVIQSTPHAGSHAGSATTPHTAHGSIRARYACAVRGPRREGYRA